MVALVSPGFMLSGRQLLRAQEWDPESVYLRHTVASQDHVPLEGGQGSAFPASGEKIQSEGLQRQLSSRCSQGSRVSFAAAALAGKETQPSPPQPDPPRLVPAQGGSLASVCTTRREAGSPAP